jgi:hypothetical protein
MDPPEFDPAAMDLINVLVDHILLADDDIKVCQDVVAEHKASSP